MKSILKIDNKIVTNNSTLFSYPFPLPVINNLQLWLDASYGITLNGSFVSQWYDRSRNGNNAIQNTVSNQPLYVSDVLNDRLSFDGSNDFFNCGDILNIHLSNWTYFIVFNSTDNTGTLYNKGVDNFDATKNRFGFFGGSLYFDAESYTISSVTTNTKLLAKLFIDKTNLTNSWYINDVSKGNTTISATDTYNTENFLIGYGTYPFDAYFKGDIYEIIIYNKILSSIEQTAVESYLNTKYMIY